MRSFLAIFTLELKSLARSRALFAIFAATGAWMAFLPRLVTSDGTADGARRLYVEYSLGGVFALLVVALAATAAGGISSMRENGVMQLEIVRPVRLFKTALARYAAISLVGFAAFVFASAVLLAKSDAMRQCSRSLKPAMESPREEALRMYDVFMNDPATPEKAKKAKKSDVVRLLEIRSRDRYDTVAAGDTAKWDFPQVPAGAENVAARFRFSTAFSGRHAVKGTVSLGDEKSDVEGFTESPAVWSLPAWKCAGNGPLQLEFKNLGSENLLLRPREDVEILYSFRSDTFLTNLAMACLELSALVALAAAFGVFLGACFGRSVAVFCVIAALAAAVAAPTAADESVGSMEGSRVDALSSAVVRMVAAATHPFDSLRPVSNLSEDRRIPAREAFGAVAAYAVCVPLALSLLSAVAIRLKQE